jgi:plastocyanin
VNRDTGQQEDGGVQDWSRRKFLLGTGGALAVGAAALIGNSAIAKALHSIGQPAIDKGLVHVYEGDYYFAPDKMTWRIGDTITIKQWNQSDYRFHEMMIGRGFDSANTLLGVQRQQFHTDFWDGVPVTIVDAHGVDNFTTNKAIITVNSGIDTGNWLDTNPADGNFSPTLLPGGWVEYRFVVPNKPGKWQYGCFVQGFVHYEEGMHGTIEIV